MAPDELFSQLSLWTVNLCPKSYTFCLYFILYLHVWIQIHKAPEYGSNTDPNPQHWTHCLLLQLWHCTFKPARSAACSASPSPSPSSSTTSTSSTRRPRLRRRSSSRRRKPCGKIPKKVQTKKISMPEDLYSYPQFWFCCNKLFIKIGITLLY